MRPGGIVAWGDKEQMTEPPAITPIVMIKIRQNFTTFIQLAPPVKLYTDSLCSKGTKWPGKSVSDVQGKKCAGGPLE